MRRFVVAALCIVLAPLSGAGHAATDPLVPPPTPARVVAEQPVGPQRTDLFVESPAMGKIVQVQVLHPAADGPRPTFYLLDGVDGEADRSDWLEKTDIAEFFADKNVNLVLPVGGKASYYTDWQRPDPQLGVNMWETFLTRELPPIIDDEFGGNGANAIGGLSMGGQAALILAARRPDLYRGVAAFSSCPDVGKTESKQVVRATVASRGGDATNMWGSDTDPAWAEHDPTALAANYAGMTVYLSVGNGILGPPDLLRGSDIGTMLAQGAPLEAGALICTREFDQRLRSVGVTPHVHYRAYGTHSWPYWDYDVRDAWPVMSAALSAVR